MYAVRKVPTHDRASMMYLRVVGQVIGLAYLERSGGGIGGLSCVDADGSVVFGVGSGVLKVSHSYVMAVFPFGRELGVP